MNPEYAQKTLGNFNAYGFNRLIEAKQIFRKIETLDGITINDFIEAVETIVEQHKTEAAREGEKLKLRSKKLYRALPQCPDCEHAMQLQAVNTNPRNQTGDNSKCMATCTNNKCMHQIFSPLTVRDFFKQHKKE